MIFLKKLSTGYDEDQTHKAQLKELEEKIESNKAIRDKKQNELRNLQADKASKQAEMSEKRRSLENEIEMVDQTSRSDLEALKNKKKQREEELNQINKEEVL